jgi:hypothetical protein
MNQYGYYIFNMAGYPFIFNIRYPAGYPVIESSIRSDTGYQNRPDYLAGYPAHPYMKVHLN